MSVAVPLLPLYAFVVRKATNFLKTKVQHNAFDSIGRYLFQELFVSAVSVTTQGYSSHVVCPESSTDGTLFEYTDL